MEQAVDQEEKIANRIEITPFDKLVAAVRGSVSCDQTDRKEHLCAMQDGPIQQGRISELCFEVAEKGLTDNLPKEPCLNFVHRLKAVGQMRFRRRTSEQEVQVAEEVEGFLPVEPRSERRYFVVRWSLAWVYLFGRDENSRKWQRRLS